MESFLSYNELGIPVYDPRLRDLADGLSFYETFEQAASLARNRSLGDFVAEVRIPDDDPSFRFERTGAREGHTTIWVEPLSSQAARMLQAVRAVRPVIQ